MARRVAVYSLACSLALYLPTCGDQNTLELERAPSTTGGLSMGRATGRALRHSLQRGR